MVINIFCIHEKSYHTVQSELHERGIVAQGLQLPEVGYLTVV